MKPLVCALMLAACASSLRGAKGLEVISIDVEGGQSTLFVSPSGESMLVDAGWSGFNGRDASRIAAAAKMAGVKKIDYLVITHYHDDHVGGVQNLSHKIPIMHFVDHGQNSETDKAATIRFTEYLAFAEGKRTVAKPGDTIPIKGLDVKVLSSDGNVIASPLPGAGQPNPACEGYPQPAAATSENPHSLGILVTFGVFRMIDLGDLPGDKDYQLACPVNKIGPVDAYVVSHHGGEDSGSIPFLRAIQPRVAIMNNGAKKGGAAATFEALHGARSPIELWQLHYAINAGKENNANDSFIANLEEVCEGKWIRLNAEKDGSFQVYNSRNKFEKNYPKK
jgi:competence protein ComEC